jgi:hypothetical protein
VHLVDGTRPNKSRDVLPRSVEGWRLQDKGKAAWDREYRPTTRRGGGETARRGPRVGVSRRFAVHGGSVRRYSMWHFATRSHGVTHVQMSLNHAYTTVSRTLANPFRAWRDRSQWYTLIAFLALYIAKETNTYSRSRRHLHMHCTHAQKPLAAFYLLGDERSLVE